MANMGSSDKSTSSTSVPTSTTTTTPTKHLTWAERLQSAGSSPSTSGKTLPFSSTGSKGASSSSPERNPSPATTSNVVRPNSEAGLNVTGTTDETMVGNNTQADGTSPTRRQKQQLHRNQGPIPTSSQQQRRTTPSPIIPSSSSASTAKPESTNSTHSTNTVVPTASRSTAPLPGSSSSASASASRQELSSSDIDPSSIASSVFEASASGTDSHSTPSSSNLAEGDAWGVSNENLIWSKDSTSPTNGANKKNASQDRHPSSTSTAPSPSVPKVNVWAQRLQAQKEKAATVAAIVSPQRQNAPVPTSTTTTAATTTATPSPPTTTQKEGMAYTEVKVDDPAGRTGAGAAVMSKGGSASSGADGDAGILAGSGVGKKANEVQTSQSRSERPARNRRSSTATSHSPKQPVQAVPPPIDDASSWPNPLESEAKLKEQHEREKRNLTIVGLGVAEGVEDKDKDEENSIGKKKGGKTKWIPIKAEIVVEQPAPSSSARRFRSPSSAERRSTRNRRETAGGESVTGTGTGAPPTGRNSSSSPRGESQTKGYGASGRSNHKNKLSMNASTAQESEVVENRDGWVDAKTMAPSDGVVQALKDGGSYPVPRVDQIAAGTLPPPGAENHLPVPVPATSPESRKGSPLLPSLPSSLPQKPSSVSPRLAAAEPKPRRTSPIPSSLGTDNQNQYPSATNGLYQKLSTKGVDASSSSNGTLRPSSVVDQDQIHSNQANGGGFPEHHSVGAPESSFNNYPGSDADFYGSGRGGRGMSNKRFSGRGGRSPLLGGRGGKFENAPSGAFDGAYYANGNGNGTGGGGSRGRGRGGYRGRGAFADRRNGADQRGGQGGHPHQAHPHYHQGYSHPGSPTGFGLALPLQNIGVPSSPTQLAYALPYDAMSQPVFVGPFYQPAYPMMSPPMYPPQAGYGHVSPQFEHRPAPQEAYLYDWLDEVRFYILGQVEYYLSVENLCKDMFLRSQMDSEGWIDIGLISTFQRIESLTRDQILVRDTLKLSHHLEVDGMRVRKRADWEAWVLPGAKSHGGGPQPAADSQPNILDAPSDSGPAFRQSEDPVGNRLDDKVAAFVDGMMRDRSASQEHSSEDEDGATNTATTASSTLSPRPSSRTTTGDEDTAKEVGEEKPILSNGKDIGGVSGVSVGSNGQPTFSIGFESPPRRSGRRSITR